MNLLLDTQVFLWLDGDQARLSSAARSACADTGNTLWLSAASAWEMQIKIGLGKLRLQRSLAETIASQQARQRAANPARPTGAHAGVA